MGAKTPWPHDSLVWTQAISCLPYCKQMKPMLRQQGRTHGEGSEIQMGREPEASAAVTKLQVGLSLDDAL